MAKRNITDKEKRLLIDKASLKPFISDKAKRWSAPIQAATTRESDKFILRLPDGMRERLAEVAESQGRTMNAVVIATLAEYLGGAKSVESQLAEIKTALLALTEKVNKQGPAA